MIYKMKNKISNRVDGKSSKRNNVVKNEFYYEYKKRSVIKRGIIITVVLISGGTFWYFKEVPIRAEMIINNNTVEWVPEKRNLKGITYHILKNGELIDKTSSLKYVDKEQVDTGVPNDISEINTFRNIKNIKILWKAPSDTSSDNTYQVFAVNKFGRKVFKTEETSGGIVSGIKKYVVKFNGKEFETTSPEFVIDSKDISKGKHTIEIKSVDRAGNESEYKTFAFDYDVVDFKFEENKIIPKDSSYTNELYNFYILDKELVENEIDIPQYDKKMFFVNGNILGVLDSENKPIMTSPSYTIKNKEICFKWEKPKVNVVNKSFYIEVVEKATSNKMYSDLIEVNGENNTFGYHYAINTSSKYSVKPTDSYTDDLSVYKSVSELEANKKYYFHVACINSTGVISETKTINIDLGTKNTLDEKKNILKKIVSKTKNSTNDEYNKIVSLLSNNFSLENLKTLSSSNIKIYLVKEDFDSYIKENYEIDATSDVCFKSKNLIFVNTNEKYSEILSNILKSLLKKED